MENTHIELLKILKLQGFNYGIILLLGIVAIIIYAILLKEKRNLMFLTISIICIVATFILAFIELSPIYSDLKKQSFIEVDEVTLISKVSAGFDWSGIRTIHIETIDGDKLLLKTTQQFEEGTFKGKIVYSKESEYLLEWIPEDDQSQSGKTGDGTKPLKK